MCTGKDTNVPLPWVETHCVEHLRQLLSDLTLMRYFVLTVGPLNNGGVTESECVDHSGLKS